MSLVRDLLGGVLGGSGQDQAGASGQQQTTGGYEGRRGYRSRGDRPDPRERLHHKLDRLLGGDIGGALRGGGGGGGGGRSTAATAAAAAAAAAGHSDQAPGEVQDLAQAQHTAAPPADQPTTPVAVAAPLSSAPVAATPAPTAAVAAAPPGAAAELRSLLACCPVALPAAEAEEVVEKLQAAKISAATITAMAAADGAVLVSMLQAAGLAPGHAMQVLLAAKAVHG